VLGTGWPLFLVRSLYSTRGAIVHTWWIGSTTCPSEPLFCWSQSNIRSKRLISSLAHSCPESKWDPLSPSGSHLLWTLKENCLRFVQHSSGSFTWQKPPLNSTKPLNPSGKLCMWTLISTPEPQAAGNSKMSLLSWTIFFFIHVSAFSNNATCLLCIYHYHPPHNDYFPIQAFYPESHLTRKWLGVRPSAETPIASKWKAKNWYNKTITSSN
jgi:hypothetical protein